MKFTDNEYKQYLQTENSIPFRDWATKWLKEKESWEKVTSQDIQALRKKIYARLDALLKTDVTNSRVFLPVDYIDRWKNQEKEIEKLNDQISSYEDAIEKLNINVLDPEDERDAKIAKKKTKLENAEKGKKNLEQQKYKIVSVPLYGYLTTKEITFFEFLLSNFSDKNGLIALDTMKIGYDMRKEIDQLLKEVITDEENRFSSTCLLLGNSLFGGKWSEKYPSECAYASIHKKLLYTEQYRHRLYSIKNNLDTLLDLVDELEEHYLVSVKTNGDL